MNRFILLAIIAAALSPAAVFAQAFGPTAGDPYGYTGVKTNAGATSFTTINGNGGTLLTPASPAATTYDDRFYAAPAPAFNFNFYGVNQTPNGVFVSTNGFLSFGGTTNTSNALNTQENSSYTNASLATTTLPLGNMTQDRAAIMPHWGDLQFTSGQTGGIYTQNRTVGGHLQYVVEWSNVAFFNSTTDGISFQVVLQDDGTIMFNYNDTTSGNAGNTHGGAATIGIHNLGGTTANGGYLQYSFNTANALANGDQIVITPGAVAPEPSLLLLAGAGVLGLKRLRSRRKAVVGAEKAAS